MTRIADQLPPEIARQIHPDRRTNEDAYWLVRDQLLKQYQGQWIGFADGKVIASGSSPVAVFHAAEASGLHPFFICVGREAEPCRIRRTAFQYDASYAGWVARPEVLRRACGSRHVFTRPRAPKGRARPSPASPAAIQRTSARSTIPIPQRW